MMHFEDRIWILWGLLRNDEYDDSLRKLWLRRCIKRGELHSSNGKKEEDDIESHRVVSVLCSHCYPTILSPCTAT